MRSESLPALSRNLWRELYKTALFETDPGKLLQNVMQAESAIVVRARQLFLGSRETTSRKNTISTTRCTLYRH
jgi:hypothetical protein